jgi:hypothetical protein
MLSSTRSARRPRVAFTCAAAFLLACNGESPGNDDCPAPGDARIAADGGRAAIDKWTPQSQFGSRRAKLLAGIERLAGPRRATNDPGGFHSRAVYVVNESGSLAVLPGALVTGIVCLGASGDSTVLADQRTADDGTFEIDCPPAEPRARGRVELSGDFVIVADSVGRPTGVAFDAESGPSHDVSFGLAEARTFLGIEYVGPIARDQFGATRPPVTVRFDPPGLHAYQSRYDADSDHIELWRASFVGFYAEEDFFRVAHEYGHAFHYVAIEPWGSYRCLNDTHAFHIENTLSCAFVEGFAHFFAAWIGGDRLDSDEALPNSASDRVLEENLYRTYQGDGSRQPGVVAAFLYDLADDASSPDGPGNTANGDEPVDHTAIPGTEIARLMRECRLVAPPACPSVDRLDGIDQFIYCAEGSLDAASLGRSWRRYEQVDPGGPQPSLWDPVQVRTLWQHDLYSTSTSAPSNPGQ